VKNIGTGVTRECFQTNGKIISMIEELKILQRGIQIM